jgi:cbb3-type cytochrome oxidase subunit 1
VPFIDVVKAATPFLRFTTLGLTVLLLGQLCFAANLARLVVAALDSVWRPACAAMGCCGESLNAGVKP